MGVTSTERDSKQSPWVTHVSMVSGLIGQREENSRAGDTPLIGFARLPVPPDYRPGEQALGSRGAGGGG